MSIEGKRQGIVELRPSSVTTQEMPHCSFCGNKDFESLLKFCRESEVGRYCSKICQRKHWASQKGICQAISDLRVKQSKKMVNIDVYHSFYTPKQKSQLVNLTGKKSTVNCFLFDMNCKILQDAGSNINVLAKAILDKSFHF